MISLINLLRFIFRIIFFLPARIALSLMYFAGWLTHTIASRTTLKTMVSENIKMLLPESQAEQIAGRLIKNVSYSIFELMCLPYFGPKHFKTVFMYQGKENIDQALKENHGAILLTLHAGNYELVPAAVAELGYKVNTVLRATHDPIFKILNRCRSHKNVKMINVSDQDMYKETLHVLARNEIVGTLADTGALEGRHVFMSFLGREVPIATGWLTLAQRSGALVVPTLTRKQGKKNIIIFYPPFKITKENREEMMQQAKNIFEDFARNHPDQWGIFLNSYETQRMVKGK